MVRQENTQVQEPEEESPDTAKERQKGPVRNDEAQGSGTPTSPIPPPPSPFGQDLKGTHKDNATNEGNLKQTGTHSKASSSGDLLGSTGTTTRSPTVQGSTRIGTSPTVDDGTPARKCTDTLSSLLRVQTSNDPCHPTKTPHTGSYVNSNGRTGDRYKSLYAYRRKPGSRK